MPSTIHHLMTGVSPHRDIFHLFFFFFNDTATTEIYTLSLHDALPISHRQRVPFVYPTLPFALPFARSEEHTSELPSRENLVCRLLLEKKKKIGFGSLKKQKKQTTRINEKINHIN